MLCTNRTRQRSGISNRKLSWTFELLLWHCVESFDLFVTRDTVWLVCVAGEWQQKKAQQGKSRSSSKIDSRFYPFKQLINFSRSGKGRETDSVSEGVWNIFDIYFSVRDWARREWITNMLLWKLAWRMFWAVCWKLFSRKCRYMCWFYPVMSNSIWLAVIALEFIHIIGNLG